jgi:hypothetical protein
MVNSEKISAIIQNIFYDIKAEALIGDLLENGLKTDDFLAINKGTFKRRYARDIDQVKTIEFENGQKVAGIYLNRDGLYDSLPEGLFHDKRDDSIKKESNISEDSKRIKEEEKQVRNFFLPFENEIFSQRIKLELEERNVLSHFSENLFNDIYPEFWNLDRKLNRKYLSRMVLLLHFSHRIAGNPSHTAKCLEYIINEKVTVQIVATDFHEEPVEEIQTNSNCKLGARELGVDFVCGDNFNKMGKTMEFTIGPLKNTTVDEYLGNGAILKFLNCFYGYFIPVELDVKMNVRVEELEQHFVLGEMNEGPVLGYESAI